MDNNVAILNEKIDRLTAIVIAQQERMERMESHTNGNVILLDKLDYLTQQFESQRRQQEELAELRQDMVPIVNHMIKLSINELAEIGSEFQAEDLLFLVKRLLRDTHLIIELLDRMESTMELLDEVQVIGQQVFHQTVANLDRMEQEGYFAFARSSWRILERIVNEFSEEDVEALGENVVTILTTVRNLTQPEIMAMTNNALNAIQIEPAVEGDVTMWALLRDMSDPKVRKGMARLLNMVKVLADQPTPTQN